MFPIEADKLKSVIREVGIADITTATIRQICALADRLEIEAAEPVVHLEIGNPGLPSERIGVDAECAALQSGVANKYPNISGIKPLKDAGSRFLKAFVNIDVPSKCIIPTVGSMQGCFTVMMLLRQRDPVKDTMLFINPGFPAQRHQAKILGMNVEAFDLHDFRGDKLEAKLESYLRNGNITGIIYSNPNNPAWTNLTEQELSVIGRLATEYDAIVLEDMAYMGMDFRRDLGVPYQAPYVPTVANYTDNYIIMLSASKIFSYAGQRIAVVCMSPSVYDRHYDSLEKFYEISTFGDCYVFGVLYTASSGTAHSSQYALAAMFDAACDGKLKFVDHSREYGVRCNRVKQMLADNGFHIIYDKDGDDKISDGFFFTAGYKNMTGQYLQLELLRYGISAISLGSTGSDQEGLRICVSMLDSEDKFEAMSNRLRAFADEH
ncbi:MAG: pyridoxal phosphate-dependent aminotransferase [Muribaculaceae bacterium]|nr:pyridoxal phosphate-dependent aminotransferase [Muribaculaceae bacterium]